MTRTCVAVGCTEAMKVTDVQRDPIRVRFSCPVGCCWWIETAEPDTDRPERDDDA